MMKRYLILAVLGCQLLVAQQVKFFNTYGGGIFDSGEGVWTSKDTGYVVGGITTPYGMNGTDMLIYKVDSLGNLQWYKNIGLVNSIEGAKSITSGNGETEYILAGYQNKYDTSGYNFFVAKTDLNGDTLWTRSYGGSDWDMAYSVDTLQDSTYVIAGETYSFGNGNSDMYVIRIDKNGDTLWTRTFGGTEDDYARYVYTDKHDNIIVIGTTYSYGAGGSDVFIVHLDPAGDTIWTKVYGTVEDEFGYSGDMYLDNGFNMSYAFAFTSLNPVSGVQEACYFRGDSASCSFIYDRKWFWFSWEPEVLDHMRMRLDGKGAFYVTGDFRASTTSEPEVFIARTDYGIIYNSLNKIIHFEPGAQYPNDIRKCFDNGMVITGSTTNFGPGPTATFIMKTDTDLVAPVSPVVAIEDELNIQFGIYPNPITDHMVLVDVGATILDIRLYDLNGRVVYYASGENSSQQVVFVPEISPGMYIIEVITEKRIGRKKLLITR